MSFRTSERVLLEEGKDFMGKPSSTRKRRGINLNPVINYLPTHHRRVMEGGPGLDDDDGDGHRWDPR